MSKCPLTHYEENGMNKTYEYSKRRYERVPVNEGVCFFDKGSRNPGKLLDCSAEGMLIETQVFNLLNPELDIVINTGEEQLHVPAQVVRIYRQHGVRTRVGLKVLRNANKYIQFVLKSALKDVPE
jgi:hypothetical protein